MATMNETPAQFERDLRSANKEWKRSKDSSSKWTHGAKPLRGVWNLSATDSEGESVKNRPMGKFSEQYSHPPKKEEHNINKFRRSQLPAGRVQSKMSAREEMDDTSITSRSILDLLPKGSHRKSSVSSDNFLYSFDRTDSPGQPLTLDIFVKTTGRDVERLVEKEYEILDVNGDFVKGRKARRALRKATVGGSSGLESEGVEVDEDGFELV